MRNPHPLASLKIWRGINENPQDFAGSLDNLKGLEEGLGTVFCSLLSFSNLSVFFIASI